MYLAETDNKEYQFTDVSICEDGSKIAIGTEKRLIVYDIESKQQQTNCQCSDWQSGMDG